MRRLSHELRINNPKGENVKKISLSVAAAALCLAASAASAQVYVGGAVGQSHYNDDCFGLSCDRTPTAYKLFGGYKLNQFVAIEGTYTDYGDFKFSDGFDSRLSGTSFGIGAAGFYDFHPQWTAVGRLGLASNKFKLRDNAGFSSSDTKIKPYFGLGIGFRLTPKTTIEAGADFTRFELNNAEAEASSGVRFLHIGVRQSF